MQGLLQGLELAPAALAAGEMLADRGGDPGVGVAVEKFGQVFACGFAVPGRDLF
jgi:hypothetical protein